MLQSWPIAVARGQRLPINRHEPNLAVQMAAGQPLRQVPEALCAKVRAQIALERKQSDLFMAAIQRMLDREQPGWSAQ